MSNTATTAPAAKTTVRMFDGAGWAEYKIGSKKHRAAEARRAEWNVANEAKKAERVAAKALNAEYALALRGIEIVPSGQAWTAFKAGERDTVVLAALNVADGLVFKKPAERKATPAKAAKATKAKTTTKAAETPAPRTGKKAARKARSAAAAKGWETRRANAAAKLETVEVVEVVEAKAPKAKKAKAPKATSEKALLAAPIEVTEVMFFDRMTAVGMEPERIATTWKNYVALRG